MTNRTLSALLATVVLSVASVRATSQDDGPIAFTREVRAGVETYVADFGRLTVPESRLVEDAPRIEVAFCRLRSTAEEPGPPVFLLLGPPGSATAMRRSPTWAGFLELGDVVLFEQRGIGESQPPTTWESADWHPERLFTDHSAAVEHIVESAGSAAAELRAGGIEPSSYNVLESADDVDALRAALGYEEIHLMGHSGGSHLALEVARRHGERVARLVSYGTAGPNDIQKLPSELDASLRVVAELVAADPRIGEAMPDLFETLVRVLVELEREPLLVSIRDPRSGAEIEVPLGPFGLQFLLVQDLADTKDLPVLPRLVHSIDARDPALVRWFLQKRCRQLGALPVAFFANRCASGATAERWARIDREARESPFGRARTLFSPEIDAALGVRHLGDDFHDPITSDVPALFISGSLDAHTPPHQAERVRRGFKRSSHLVIENAGHDDLLPHPVARERVLAFLGGRSVPDETLPGPSLSFALLEGSDPEASHPALEASR